MSYAQTSPRDNIPRAPVGAHSSSSRSPSPFENLPVDIASPILRLAARSSQSTYRSLLLVSRQFKVVARLHCLPDVPIVLKSPEKVQSFYNALLYDEDIRLKVRHLWISAPPCGSPQQRTVSAAIVNTCKGIISLGCHIDILAASICSPGGWSEGSFPHTSCTDLTLAGCSEYAWYALIGNPNGARFTNQLTHLRILGSAYAYMNIPKLSCSNLTHLSFPYTTLDDMRPAFSNAGSCPKLQGVVLTVDFGTQRRAMVINAGMKVDPRCFVALSSGAWNEVDIWERGVLEEESVWDLGTAERKSWLSRFNI